MQRLILVALMVFAGPLLVTAEQLPAPLSFEAASIKRNTSGELGTRFETPPGRLNAINVPARFLIRQAYRVPEARVLGGPAWLDTDRFDIVATTPGSVNTDAVRGMLRALLAERFGLMMHTETREMPIYVLQAARGDGTFGPNLRRSSTDCTGRSAAMANGRVQCGILVSQGPGSGSLRGGAATIENFARLLGDFLERPLNDETGLTGIFDFELQFTAPRSSSPGAVAPGGLSTSAGPDDVPTVFTALQEQLGLKLDAQRGRADVWIVDAVAPPVDQAVNAAQPAFEVASIRRNTVGFAADTSRVEGGRYIASNMTLDQLVHDAYRMQVSGGPEWAKDPPGPPRAGEVRFDVIATFPPETAPDRVPLMLRTLLAERFTLVVHTETREQPAYALVYAREDKRLGPQMTPSTQQCRTEIESGPLRAPVTRVTDDGKPVCGIMMSPQAIRGGGLTMRFLANAIGVYAGRMVVDRTGLTGPFDFHLTYAAAARGGGPAPSDDRPSIFVAVQEQLGLKLEPANAPVEVVVIDSASMPTEN